MLTEHKLFLVLGIAPKSKRRFARSGGSLSAPGSLLATDRSKAVVLV